jgi:hypothetical protein
MRVLGVKSVKVTNARGFCLELSTAIVVVLASRYGAALPWAEAWGVPAIVLMHNGGLGEPFFAPCEGSCACMQGCL